MRETSHVSPFQTCTRAYKGSCIPLWVVFLAAVAVACWRFAIRMPPADIILVGALVAVAISGCALFIAILNYFSHEPIKVTVTSHAIRIDDGDDPMIIRLIDLIEVQRSRSWLMDEIVLKAMGDRGFLLENLREPDEFLNALVANASTVGNRRKNGREAAFSLVTKNSHLKLQEMVGRKKLGASASSLELTNNFTSYLSTFPLVAFLPSILAPIFVLVIMAATRATPITGPTLGIAGLVVPSLYLVICYVLFIEKQISINEDEIVIESSTDRTIISKNTITDVYSLRAGLSRVIKLSAKGHGTITLRGFAHPERVEGAIRWITTSSRVRNEAAHVHNRQKSHQS